jgi:hypothetical protein
MNMKRSFNAALIALLTLTLGISPALVHAEGVLFLAPTAKEQDFAVYLQTKPEYISFVDFWIERNPLKADVDHLLEVFERAQLAYLNNPFDEAKALFENVVQLAHQSDWKALQREVLFTSLLRLSQLEQSSESKKHYIKRAVALDHEMEPNTSLFPPPFVEEFKSVRKEMREQAYVWKKPDQEQTALTLLNGKKINFRKPVLITEGFHRLTIVSNSRTVWTKVISQRDFEKLHLDRKTFAVGNCEKGRVAVESDVGINSSHMFFGPQCLKDFGKRPVDIKADFSPGPRAEQIHAVAPSDPIWKKTWFWVAIAGVALTAVVISQNNQKQERSSTEVKPTHTQGL